jgi:DNA modification methylase
LTLPDGVKVEIKPAKGRPMLTWVGKRPLRQVTAFPAQLIETFKPDHGWAGVPSRQLAWDDWPAAYPRGGLMFHGDNKEVLAHLLANGFRGKVKLIYIDPPFDSGADYVRKVTLRGAKGTAKIEGEGYTLGEQIQYTDIWANDNYLQFMYERLLLLKELLAEDGNIFMHCDSRKSHLLRCIMDEIFGPENFRNEIVREKQRGGKHHVKRSLGSIHDTIFHYSKSDEFIWNEFRRDIPDRIILERYPYEDEKGRYALADCTNYKVSRPNLTYEFLGFYRTWKWTQEEMQRKYQEGEVVQVAPGRVPRRKVRANPEGDLIQSLWYDVPDTSTDTDYPTEKSPELIRRIIELCSDTENLILDCFIGSGTTAAVAQKLCRRWIGCDINKGAIQTTCKRLQTVILEQMEAVRKGKQLPLPPAGEGAQDNGNPPPAQLSFSVYRVNDYDLAIQHNEAVNLACEHLGITRTRTDAFFDGALGKKLAKIIPFGHPLTLLDLEEIKRELGARPEEERDICVVCLGKETAADGWLEDWNRLRKQGDVPNKIEVIELRTDPRYGKFFVHQPATARVSITRDQGKIRVEIQDFISPTIIERLKQQSGLLTPQIDDWRAMVDSVMIDLAYNGEVFNVAFADVPPKKSDLVAGQYDLDAPEGETTVAVKITDMLGEEVLVTQKI